MKSLAKAAFAALAICAGLASAADPVAPGKYVITAREDAVLQARKGGPGPASGSYTGLPLLRDMDFRIRNDALDPDNMRYTLRLEPRGLGEGRAARLYNATEVRRSKDRDKLLFNRALLDRYLIAVDCLMWASLHRLNGELIAVLEDRIRVLEKMKDTEDFNISDLIEAEADLTKLRAQDLDVEKEQGVLEQRIAMQMGLADPTAFGGLDVSGLVSVDSIVAEVEKGLYVLDTGHVYLDYLKRNLDLAETRYKLEVAQGRQYLNHLSFSYDVGERIEEMNRRDDGKNYDLARAYAFEVGFRLPFLTDGRQDINRRKEDLLSEREDYAQQRREMEDIMRKDLRDIRSLVIQHRYLKAREGQVDGESSLKKYLQMAGADPLAMLSIKAANLRNRLKQEEVRFGIILNWIKVLDAAGQLSEEPLRNYLAAGAPELPR